MRRFTSLSWAKYAGRQWAKKKSRDSYFIGIHSAGYWLYTSDAEIELAKEQHGFLVKEYPANLASDK